MPVNNGIYIQGTSSLDGAVGDIYTHPRNHTCGFCRPCEYPHHYRKTCGEIIHCGAVSEHFRDKHGIVDMGRHLSITCMWTNCWKEMSRHNFVRHVREQHLFHSRP
ncbi:hypothetical protein SCLCIDRAFT_947484 [Scleroderma citrinum Foug A]|uniref:C2H2-type domain-containing protein n=1 Tax=Scleroderma citrinum Foug A TaxID=1036808 RepID=A0A0C3DI94_9AGAM|nr:hypothetical protein SCLCIDRAFT_947484 [Scleroderma citrinum Foug A]